MYKNCFGISIRIVLHFILFNTQQINLTPTGRDYKDKNQ